MSQVLLKNVYKIYPGDKGGDVTAVRDFNLEVKARQFVVFVGPSGCGKSTTLRMIAGLEEITRGDIFIGDRRVNDVPPKDRDIAMVFQNYALYPHMSVFENMAFGLKLRRFPRAEIRKRVEEVADTLGLEQLLDRKPKALSGGQRQRVALGRAIVRQPQVFLFDEPLSNLDAKMRIQMRTEIIKLHQRLKATIIYVTHDQVEAMTMGEVIVVMDAVVNPETGLKEGVVQQVDTPFNLYETPANKFVAGFLGSPPMNFFRGRIEAAPGGAAFHETDGKATAFFPGKNPSAASQDVLLGVRPEGIHLLAPGADAPGSFEAPVDIVEYMGAENYLYANSGALTFLCRDNTRAAAEAAGSRRRFSIDPAAAHFFAPETGLRVAF